MRSILNP